MYALCTEGSACQGRGVDQADSGPKVGVNPILADLQTLKGELELQLHLGTMEAKDAWKDLQSRFVAFEARVEAEGGKLIDDLAGAAEELKGELQAFYRTLENK